MDAPTLLLISSNGIKVESDIFELETSIIKIGRDSTADLRIPDLYISRLQAEIYYEHEKWFIRDIQSKNGTFVNDVKIGMDPVQLKDGDKISFSGKILYLYQEEEFESIETKTMAVKTDPFGIIMDKDSEEVYVDGIKITPRFSQLEWNFLSVLMEEPGKIRTYKELAQKMFNIKEDFFDVEGNKKYLQSTKSDISKKLHNNGITREVIKSRSNKGYQLVPKDTRN